MAQICDTVTNFPPPPPLPNFSVIFPVNGSKTNEAVESKEVVLSYITKVYKNLTPGCEELPPTFKYTHLKPLIQDGPTCGLVALAMITSSTGSLCSVNDLFDIARNRGFTKKGEMFSSSNMATLASGVLSGAFEIQHCRGGMLGKKGDIVNNLLSGSLYMIPYDADKNHSPANLKGLKAHWAILCGILEDSSNCYVLARQSKSRLVALWDFQSLQESNKNLSEIAIDKAESEEYVTDDIKISLAGNFILFKNI